MKRIKEIEFVDILNELPDITPLNCDKDLSQLMFDIFLCALGFEDRCPIIPEQLAKVKDFRCKQALYFEYSTNVKDNEVNKQGLIRAFQQFADSYKSFQCDEDNFAKNLREYISEFIKSAEKPKIIFDISVCSSKLLLSVMKILLEFDIYLLLVYSEAMTYHPTPEEFGKDRQNWATEEGFGIARGVGKVIPGPEHPGACKENPDLIVAFLTFKPERTRSIITKIDETLLIRPDKRIIWIIGDPHMDDDTKRRRKEIMREINKIPKECPSYEVCTFNYKETIKRLDRIYNDNNLDFHINISALGSKMQSLGVAIFYYVRPDVSIYFAIPEEYNAKQYSEGWKETWQINFGDLATIKKILNRVGQIENY